MQAQRGTRRARRWISLMKQELLVILSVLATFVVLESIFTGFFRKPGGTPGYPGLGWVYAGYIVVKMTVIYAARSDVRRDEPLYKNKWHSPPMWVVERIVSTPATHSSHRGKRAADGVTNYKGNYGAIPKNTASRIRPRQAFQNSFSGHWCVKGGVGR